jgi:hypothetical protein
MRAKPGPVRFLFTHNPFYLIGTALLLYGLQIASDSGSAFARQPLILASILAAVILAMALIAITIIRIGGVWEDARTILLSIMLLCVGVVTGCDGTIHSQPEIATLILGGSFLFCVAIWELLLRSLRFWFPPDVRIPFYCILGLIFFYSLVFGPAEAWIPGLEDISAAWKVYAFGWLLGGCILFCLPAVWQGRDLFRDTGTPWNWPVYPWSIFVVLVIAACLRLYLLSLAFFPGHGWTSPFGIHFFLPVAFSAMVLLVEALIVQAKDRKNADIGYGIMAFAVLLCALPFSGTNMQSNFLRELTLTVGSPFWIALMLILAYGALLWLRGFRQLSTSISLFLAVASICHPQRLVFTPEVQSLWPLVLLLALQAYMAIQEKSLERWMFLACVASVISWFGVAQFDERMAWFVGVQVFWGLSLIIGLGFRSPTATWVRLLALGMMIMCCLAAMALALSDQISGLAAASYVGVVQLLLLGFATTFKWPLLFRLPVLMIPITPFCVLVDQQFGLRQAIGGKSGLFLIIAASCFGIGFLISAGKAGWLKSITRDFANVYQTLKDDLGIESDPAPANEELENMATH